MTTIVPQTFYLSGGAVRSTAPPSSREVIPGSCSAEGESGASSGDGGHDDRAEFLAFSAKLDGLSGTSSPPLPPSSSSSAGLLPSSKTIATSPADPELVSASKTITARESPLPYSTATEEDAGALAVEDAAPRSGPPERDEPSDCDPWRNPSMAARGAMPPRAGLADKDGISPQAAAESCPPDTVLRLASPPPPTLLSPSPSPGTIHPQGGSPETLGEESPPPKREDDEFVPNGSVLLGIDTRLPEARGRRANKCAQSERRGKTREEQKRAGIEGPVLGGGPEGTTPEERTTANRSGIQPKLVERGSQNDDDEIRSRAAEVEAKRSSTSGDITPEKTARKRRNSVDIKPGGAAEGMPTWVVKPAANTNCGFGIQVCCSLKVNVGIHPLVVDRYPGQTQPAWTQDPTS